ncbi:MAG: hypothetical protein JETT_1253 [Candidatus Jettenia ecosi]|uniref:Uncharacterized protein n=1 Tax=Candidatus Jettenia ecosi TaxID=2494326 RepID=A0A533QCI1_9BACT|nr:MAG: hypothetical protein JETT_1253 [Candidatus Jettenia ecosi]
MKFHPYWIIVALIIFLPSEDFILKWLPVSDKVYSYSRILSELSVYSLLILVLLNRIFQGLPLRRTPIDIPLLLFIFLGIVSIVVNKAPLFGGLLGIRTLLRYIAVYYLIVNSNLSPNHIRRLILLVIVIAIGESLLACIQHFYGISNFWLPRTTDLEIAGYSKVFTVLSGALEKGASIGTFCHSVNMALYLLIAIISLLSYMYNSHELSKIKKTFQYIGLCIIFIGILFTYSRGIFLATLFMVPIILILLQKKRTLLKFTIISFILISFIINIFLFTNQGIGTKYKRLNKEYTNPLDNLRLMLSSEYVEKTKGSRQWILKEVGSTIIGSLTLIGFSPDELTAREKILKASGGTLRKIITSKAFEDVYWIALLAYFGIIGETLFIWILYKLYTCSNFVLRRAQNYIFTSIAVSFSTLIILTIPLTFLVRTFEFRPFCFLFWLMAGLVMNEYLRLRVQNKPLDLKIS